MKSLRDDEGFRAYMKETRARAVVVVITMAVMFVVFYAWAVIEDM